MMIVLVLILLLLVVFFTGTICYFKLDWFKWFYHDILSWHVPNPDDHMGFDGCSFISTCKHCHKEIMQDSQGNWF